MITCYYLGANKKLATTDNWEKTQEILADTSQILYINVHVPTEQELNALVKIFNLKPITIKNLTTKKFNSNVEETTDYIASVLYDIYTNDQSGELKVVPLTLILAKNATLLITEEDSPTLNGILGRVSDDPQTYFSGASSLYSCIVESVVDNHFPVMESLEETLDALEEDVSKAEAHNIVQRIAKVRRDIANVKKAMTFEQEIMYRMLNLDTNLMDKTHNVYLKNVFHHLEKLNSTINEYRTWTSNLSDQYSTNLSNKLNDLVQKLTILSFIFLPLSFLSGWYGMNWKNQPELNLDYGYFYLIGVSLVLTFSLLYYFKKKKWL